MFEFKRTVESHSHRTPLGSPDRLEGWMVRYRKKILWIVFWRNEAVAVFFKRQWAREFINELKVQWIHES